MPHNNDVHLFIGLKFNGTADGLRAVINEMTRDAVRLFELHGKNINCGGESYDFEFHPANDGPKGHMLYDLYNYIRLCNNDE